MYFDRQINERLRGLTSLKSLEILMEKIPRPFTPDKLNALVEKKDDLYQTYLRRFTPNDVFDGIADFVSSLKKEGFKLAICSTNKNVVDILNYLKISHWFDAVVSGTESVESKSDSAAFILTAKRLGIEPERCVVIENTFAGVCAVKNAGMKTLGIGFKLVLHNADYVLPSTEYLSMERVHLLY